MRTHFWLFTVTSVLKRKSRLKPATNRARYFLRQPSFIPFQGAPSFLTTGDYADDTDKRKQEHDRTEYRFKLFRQPIRAIRVIRGSASSLVAIDDELRRSFAQFNVVADLLDLRCLLLQTYGQGLKLLLLLRLGRLKVLSLPRHG